MAYTEYEKYTTGDTGGASIWGTAYWVGQSFTVTNGHIIKQVSLKLSRGGTGGLPGTVTILIYNTDSNGFPVGDSIASGTVNGNSFTTDVGGSWENIELTNTAFLSAGTKYSIVVKALEGNNQNTVGWRYDSSGSYAGGNGQVCQDEGDWSDNASWDHMFKDMGDLISVPASDQYTTKKLVAIGGLQVYYESSSGTMSQLAASVGTLNTSDFIDMFEAYGKALIVNHSIKKVVDLINVKIHTTSLLGGDTYPIHGTVIEGGTSGAKMVVDYITALTGDTYVYGKRTTTVTFQSGETCTGSVTIDGTPTSVSFVLDADEVSGPHYYNWTSYGNSSTIFGSLPDKVILGCNYMGRAVVAGDEDNPHQWYMSRQENIWDFLYGVNDALSAVAGHNADAGEVGDIIKALIPYKDDYLLFGGENSIWYLIGNPCDGGSIEPFSLSTGIYGAKSWCFDNNGNLYFWGKNGIYKTTIPGQPICISEIKLPNLVNDEAANPSTHRITFQFDVKRNGIIIAITVLSDGTNSNYFYDLRSIDDNGMGGFFPEEYPEECAIFSMFYYEAIDPTYRKLVIGCNDGYLRFLDETSEDDVLTDDTVEAIDSYISFGPIAMSSNSKFVGKLVGFFCVPAGGASGGSESDSDDIDYKIFVANSAEEVIEKLYANSSPAISGIVTAPGRRRGTVLRKSSRGVYMGIRIGNNTEGETWALEQLFYDVKDSGRFK